MLTASLASKASKVSLPKENLKKQPEASLEIVTLNLKMAMTNKMKKRIEPDHEVKRLTFFQQTYRTQSQSCTHFFNTHSGLGIAGKT